MAQLDGSGRHSKSARSPTIEQLLRKSASERWSPMNFPTTTTKNSDYENDQSSSNQRKSFSVLAKVKEKAKKWRQTLSKKKAIEGENTTPSWGVRLDEEEEDEDPEYLGAPMYESELAPEGLKEAARQHPRTVPAIADKNIFRSSVKFNGDENYKEMPSNFKSSNNSRSVEKTVTMTVTPQEHPLSQIPEVVTSKVETVCISAPGSTTDTDEDAYHEAEELATQETDECAPQETEALGVIKTEKQESNGQNCTKTESMSSPREFMWDKGVSMKEYMAQKFQPGEDEKALSQIISTAMSPRKSLRDVGLVGKVKEAVNSLLWSEGSGDQANDIVPTKANDAPVVTSPSPQIPISTNAQEVVEEENNGRLLQG